MVLIKGIGWITNGEFGCIAKEIRAKYIDVMAVREDLFSYPFKNFGRLDVISVKLCCAVALALKDARIDYYTDKKQETGIIGTNFKGCLQSDIQYFRDYLESGRKMARGSLFIYTLPSSPLGEAAIHFGLQGPLLYVSGFERTLSKALSMAADIILFEGVPVMLAGFAEEKEALFFVLVKDAGTMQGALCSADKALSITDENDRIPDMIKEFSMLKKESVYS